MHFAIWDTVYRFVAPNVATKFGRSNMAGSDALKLAADIHDFYRTAWNADAV